VHEARRTRRMCRVHLQYSTHPTSPTVRYISVRVQVGVGAVQLSGTRTPPCAGVVNVDFRLRSSLSPLSGLLPLRSGVGSVLVQ
jgi:hypothetical protein